MLRYILIILFVFVIAAFIKRKNSAPQSNHSDHHRSSFYRVRSSVLDAREQAFFFELTKQLPSGLHIFPKMRIADILETTSGKGYRKQLYGILPKHVDFVVADGQFRPLCAIELNGSSHQRWKAQRSDELKKEVFASAGFPLHNVPVGSQFSEEIRAIMATFANS